MKTLFACIVGGLIVCSIASGGWQRISDGNGVYRTSWVDHPSHSTAWGRDSDGNVYVLKPLLVYPDTVSYMVPGVTNDVPSFGFWTVDSSCNVFPNTTAGDYLTISNKMGRYDVEWGVDSDGNVYPKD